MKRTFILLLISFLSSISYGQTFSYSFEGSLSAELISEIEKTCSNLPQVSSTKIRYKEDSKRGEIIIKLDDSAAKSRTELGDQFSPVSLKELLLQLKLSPLDFRKIND